MSSRIRQSKGRVFLPSPAVACIRQMRQQPRPLSGNAEHGLAFLKDWILSTQNMRYKSHIIEFIIKSKQSMDAGGRLRTDLYIGVRVVWIEKYLTF